MFGDDDDSGDGYSMESMDDRLDNVFEKINGERCSPSTIGEALSKSESIQLTVDNDITTHTLLTRMESTPSKSPLPSKKAVTSLGRQKLDLSF